MDQLIIAIDGFSACGKSTLAKELAQELDLIYIDTGAMYRAVTLYFFEHEVPIDNIERVSVMLDEIEITFQNITGENKCFLNGDNVENKIRSQEISDLVSDVAKISKVRTKMVALQRKMGESMDLVMDGRDIGTVVYPNSRFKFFMTADEDIRVERRLTEFQLKGVKASKEEVKANLQKRDFIDSNREESPLKVAEDAIIIDNSYLNKEEQVNLVRQIIEINQFES